MKLHVNLIHQNFRELKLGGQIDHVKYQAVSRRTEYITRGNRLKYDVNVEYGRQQMLR